MISPLAIWNSTSIVSKSTWSLIVWFVIFICNDCNECDWNQAAACKCVERRQYLSVESWNTIGTCLKCCFVGWASQGSGCFPLGGNSSISRMKVERKHLRIDFQINIMGIVSYDQFFNFQSQGRIAVHKSGHPIATIVLPRSYNKTGPPWTIPIKRTNHRKHKYDRPETLINSSK